MLVVNLTTGRIKKCVGKYYSLYIEKLLNKNIIEKSYFKSFADDENSIHGTLKPGLTKKN